MSTIAAVHCSRRAKLMLEANRAEFPSASAIASWDVVRTAAAWSACFPARGEPVSEDIAPEKDSQRGLPIISHSNTASRRQPRATRTCRFGDYGRIHGCDPPSSAVEHLPLGADHASWRALLACHSCSSYGRRNRPFLSRDDCFSAWIFALVVHAVFTPYSVSAGSDWHDTWAHRRSSLCKLTCPRLSLRSA